MSTLIPVLKFIAPLIAALIIGNWFLAEIKKSRSEDKPWYRPYLSIPGLLIIFAILLPIFLWIIKK